MTDDFHNNQPMEGGGMSPFQDYTANELNGLPNPMPNQESKGPEELAEEYGKSSSHDHTEQVMAACGFTAGYEAATTQLQSRIKELEEENKKLDLKMGFLETENHLSKMTDRLKESKITSLEAVVKELIEWDKKYPAGHVYGYDRAKSIESGLTKIIEKFKSKL